MAARHPRTRRAPRGRGDDGAVIVEAAFVLPIVLLLIFGMIDFGVNLSDQIAVRDGVREGVRQAVVDAPNAQSVDEIVSFTNDRIGLDGDAYVYVNPQAVGSAAAGSPGSNLTVCAYVPMRSLSGMFSGLLDGRYMWSKTTMRVEQDLTFTTAGGDSAPSGKNWDDCNDS